MNFLYIFLALGLFFTGCADKNAFSKFNIETKQELALSVLQSAKIKSSDGIEGVFSAVYLNRVYPESFNQNEYFYIYLYTKEKREMFNPNLLEDIDLSVRLNGKLPVKIKELPHNNRFLYLASIRSEWQRYFLVAFEEESGVELNLRLQTSDSSSDILIYQKDEL